MVIRAISPKHLKPRLIAILGAALSAFALWAENAADTLRLEEMEVEAKIRRPLTSSEGMSRISAKAMQGAVRMLGEVDYVAQFKSLGGVTSLGSDYGAGVSIGGSAPGQVSYRIDGVQVFMPYHFGGIFSVFLPSHFPLATLIRTASRASSPSNCAGTMMFSSAITAPKRLSGEVNIGPITPSATLRLPLAAKNWLDLSGRFSLLNQLYPRLMKSPKQQRKYSFYDLYATLHVGDFSFTAAHNQDKLTIIDNKHAWPIGVNWGNSLGSATWVHEYERFTTRHSVGLSHAQNELSAQLSTVHIIAPAAILSATLNGRFDLTNLPFSTGYCAEIMRNTPQSSRKHELGATNESRATIEQAKLLSLWAEAPLQSIRNIEIVPGIKATELIDTDNKYTFHFDPFLSINWTGEKIGRWSAHFSRRHQYTQEVGFSDIGLASNFRMLPGGNLPSVETLNYSLGWSQSISTGLQLAAEVFYKKVNNEACYRAAVFDLLNPGFNAHNYTVLGRGFNAGGNITASWLYGPLSLTGSYSYTMALRHYQGEDNRGWYNAPWSIPHNLNLSASWMCNEHWSLAAQLVMASGRPISPTKAIYIISDVIISTYGVLNSDRLPAYCRLDLSGTYTLRHRNCEHRINLSLINATGYRNVEMQTFDIDQENNTYYLRYIYSMFRFMPSLSYTLCY